MKKKHQSDLINWENIWNPKSLLQIFVGAGMAVFAMKGFMIPNRFMDGGVTGISLLLHEAFHINISLLVIVFNLPFIYLGYQKIGKTFAVQTTLAVILLALGLQFIDIQPVTTDKLLIAIFGGILIGTGVGLVIRSGGVIDGAEVIAVFTRRRTGFSNSEIIMLFNTFILAWKPQCIRSSPILPLPGPLIISWMESSNTLRSISFHRNTKELRIFWLMKWAKELPFTKAKRVICRAVSISGQIVKSL